MTETEIKLTAIKKFKEFYSQYDSRIKTAGNYRFSVGLNDTHVIVRLVYYGKRYKQVYRIKDL